MKEKINNGPREPRQAKQIVFKKVNTASNLKLNFRKKPNGEVIQTLKNGDKVEFISQKEDWCHVRYKGISGYVMTKYLGD